MSLSRERAGREAESGRRVRENRFWHKQDVFYYDPLARFLEATRRREQRHAASFTRRRVTQQPAAHPSSTSYVNLFSFFLAAAG